MAVREMATVRKIHSQNLIAILNRSEIDSHVCLGAAVWLHVRMLGSEQFFCAIDRLLPAQQRQSIRSPRNSASSDSLPHTCL